MSKENFIINGKTIRAKEFDFNFVCELGAAGIDLNDIGKKIMPVVREYVAYCMGVDSEYAGNEINNHIINGGKLEELVEVINTKVEESAFFRTLGQAGEKEAPKRNTKKKAEASE